MSPSRRALLRGAAAHGAAALLLASPAALAQREGPPGRYPDPAVEVLDPSFNRYRLALAAVERLATGFRWSEGPAWFGDQRCLVGFTALTGAWRTSSLAPCRTTASCCWAVSQLCLSRR